MSGQHFEVVFRGDIELGQSVAEVKLGLAKLFNADASRIDQMFSGKPVVIKGNLDETTANQYQSSLKRVGALVEIRAMDSGGSDVAANNKGLPAVSDDVETTSQEPEEPEEDFDFDVAPLGVDILPAEHKKDFTPLEVDTSHLTVSAVGADVLDDKDKRSYEDLAVDLSHLSVVGSEQEG
jgi:hypothetical protein